MDAKSILFVGLATVLVVYLVALASGGLAMPTMFQTLIGFVTAFFDTLGIGSFATTTAVFKLRNMISVKEIPGTLNVGHTLSTIAQAFIYTQIVKVDSMTLLLMILGAMAGSWLAAGVVVHWPRRRIQIGMGIALLGAAVVMMISQLNAGPGGGTRIRAHRHAAGDRRRRQLRARRAHDARHRPVRAVHDSGQPARHEPDGGISDHDGLLRVPDAVQQRTLHPRADLQRPGASIGLALGGLPAAIIAAKLVESLPLYAVKWLVVVVVIYTAANMLLTAEEPEEPGGLLPSRCVNLSF